MESESFENRLKIGIFKGLSKDFRRISLDPPKISWSLPMLSCLMHIVFMQGFKPSSYRKIAKDYRPKTGKDHDILKESV